VLHVILNARDISQYIVTIWELSQPEEIWLYR